MTTLLAQKHALFLFRSLKFLPTPYQAEDSNRLTLAYFCLSALALLLSSAVSSAPGDLSALDVLLKPKQREQYLDWIYAQQELSGGFRGSNSLEDGQASPGAPSGNGANSIPGLIPLSAEEEDEFAKLMAFDGEDFSDDDLPDFAAPVSPFSSPNLVQSYAALLNLGLLGDDYVRLERRAMIRFLARCQNDDGSFSLYPGCLEPGDPRSTYSAFAISSILSDWSGVDVDRALSFISTCQRPEGGFASRPALEAQGGMTYCSIAAYSLASKIDSLKRPEAAVRWLVSRQVLPPARKHDADSEEEDQAAEEERIPVAGFQGRIGKDTDACYSFWCTASLQLLVLSSDLLQPQLDRNWLLSCQHAQYGGIAREVGALPDIYHSYLALAALALGRQEAELSELDPAWNVSKKVKERMRMALDALRKDDEK